MPKNIADLEHLSPQEKRALLTQLLQEKAAQPLAAQPLSYGQQALWFLHQSAPESIAYNTAFATRIRSAVDVPALRRAFRLLAMRHPALRTTFAVQANGMPGQQVHEVQDVYFEQIDASAWNQDELRKQVVAAAHRPFDLEHGPLLRVSLFTQAERDHILLLALHHIIIDGWSLWLLLNELRLSLLAETTGSKASLPLLKWQYPDYVRWQTTMLDSPAGEQLWTYWQRQLAGELPWLDLPTDHPRPPIQTYNGASLPFTLTRELTQQLKKLAQTEGVTLYMLLLAVFQVLLHRYTGQETILIGSPTTGRSQPEFAEIIGYFVNMVVLRADFSENLTFREFVRQVRQTVLAALTHQDYPFPLLVERLQPNRDPGRSPLFQVSFVLHRPQQVQNHAGSAVGNAADAQIDLTNLEGNWGGLTLEPFEIAQQEGALDLALEMTETREFVRGAFKYNTDLFAPPTIARMLGHFQTLLAGICANPEQRLAELPLLTNAEQHQILTAWNATAADYPQDRCVHELFEAQTARTPDAVAVVFGDQQLTYCELNRRANQLARYLRTLEIGPEVLVGVCVGRSIEMVVGLLGILKAGGAYLPLDPSYPQERLAFMMEDSKTPVLLTQKKFAVDLGEAAAHVVCLDSDWALIAQQPPENLENRVTAENLAYVIYTSGSTGKPKGVQLTHRGIPNLCAAQIRAFDVRPDSRMLQFASLSFDASVSEIFVTFLAGATLYVHPQEELLPGPSLSQILRDQAISVVTLPPSALAVMEKEEFPALRTIVSAGEPCSAEIIKGWSPGRRFVNAYGPTETTVCATINEQADPNYPLSIGRPMSNTQIYLVDLHLQPVPVGVPGELCIGGISLARGYLNRPDLTAAKFIPNPFVPTPPPPRRGDVIPLRGGGGVGRLYKTGDLARYLSNGEIEFLGRIDHQVKIRGFRIELEEIETILAGHPAVREVVVIVREDHPGDKRLVAYLVLIEAAEPALSKVEGAAAPNDLRRFLKEQLPDYMVPAAFVILPAFPLTPNGKIDRRALPAPDVSKSLAEGYVAPRTAVEKILADIWAEVLKVKQVGMHDNFFELGGDSILSIQIMTRAQKAGCQLKPNQIFQYQTIAELAAVASAHSEGNIHPSPILRGEQGIVTGTAPLTPIQHRFFEQKLPEPHHWNQALLLEVRQALEPALLEQVVQALLAHHDALRLCFGQSEAQWQQTYAGLQETIPFAVFDFSQFPETEQGQAIETTASELQRSFNLAEGPLIRVALFDLGAGKTSRLFIVIHHLAIDGVSWRILLEDFQTAYQQLQRDEPVQLPPKTTSFKAWAERLTAYATTLKVEITSQMASTWQIPLLGGGRGGSALGENTEASAAQVTTTLSVEQTRALLQDVPSAYNTQINDVLLTALAQAFQRWTGEHRIVVDLEGHGREELFADVDLSRTVGWFTTLFPVLLEITTDHPGEALKSIKEQLRRIPQRGIGYGLLRYLSPDAETRHQLEALPQAKVSFNYLGQLDQMVDASPLFQTLAQEPIGPLHSPLGQRRHLIEINSFIVAGKLHIAWTYSTNIDQQAAIEHLAENFSNALQALIAHCQAPEAGGYTPSDFPEVALSQNKLDQILAEIDEDVG